MALAQAKKYSDDPRKWYREVRSGTRVSADFTVTLGFEPLKVEVTNATDRISAIWHSDDPTPNLLQLLTVAAGTRTHEICGISVTGKVISITRATKTLETDDDVTIIEAWG